MKIYVESGVFKNSILWVLKLIDTHIGGGRITIVLRPDESDVCIGVSDKCDVLINSSFYDELGKGNFQHRHFFDKEPLLFARNGEPDFLSTIFYLTNAIQEYDAYVSDLDKYGRYRYSSSLQYKFGIIEENYVSYLIQRFLHSVGLERNTNDVAYAQSRIFLSHDIDFLYSGFFTESLWALKHFHLADMWKIVSAYVLNNHPYFNIDEIIRLDTEHGFKSCFYWIAQQGRSDDGIKNGDYNWRNDKVRQAFKNVAMAGCENGIHKSAMPKTLEEELKILPEAPVSNRYHFLRYNWPEALDALEESSIELDASLGFAEHHGFRNSYGLPFKPFNLNEDRTYNIVCAPLHVMDGTFLYYLKEDKKLIARKVIDFIDQNKSNCVLSLLWHNNELSQFSFKEMAGIYVEILTYLKEEKFQSILPSEIIQSLRHWN